MGQPISIVSQYVMDSFYTNYKTASDFFTLEDFIFHTGAVIADAYNNEYKEQYALNRGEKKDDIVVFDPTWLNDAVIKVERKDDGLYAELPEPVMNFTYDQCSVGIQSVFSHKPNGFKELERASLNDLWQLEMGPTTSRIFFIPMKEKVRIVQRGLCSVQEIQVFYVPAISDQMTIPDGLVEFAIEATVDKMRKIKTGTLIKKSIDNNQNLIPATEVNNLGIK